MSDCRIVVTIQRPIQRIEEGFLMENYESTPILFKPHPHEISKNYTEEFYNTNNDDIITGSRP